jgi:hypothetical protein
MRKMSLSLVVVAILLFSVSASAQSAGDLAKNPWSAGVLIGVGVQAANGGSGAAFAMELPFEYTFVLGPGNLVPHFGFMLLAGEASYVAIGLPMGVRYKMQITKYPIYVWPLFDIGPGFVTEGGGAFGMIRFGGGASYLVHPNIELIFQPLALGATFASGGGAFLYNFLVGAQGRF